ncbi:cytochrome cd1-nitrite reductase-like C-terminal heme d1 [Penicillium canariense]|uniref:Cytochrome cd1-nitrite reductase-like C-terminal heme d1 n=1 Tax=Penicillium canariense TaxID=189055 RepID=A0A9W9I5F9_9EURO|nr:cytochrome cd1-nitrite reductase-like C-terminal heme d1 [Penicillium canariense]KAJ5166999.1 cytochrome cd1-nitrite reductase-like C-terminal heme d1 [Penicillium canariense]
MRVNPFLLLFHNVAFVSGLSYQLASTVPWTPKNATSVDQGAVYNGTYYLADRTNSVVHVVDLATSKEKTSITGFIGQRFTKNKTDSSISGPDGLVVLPDRNELYIGDGDGSVKVVDLFKNTIIANISTGSKKRADEFAYNPQTQTIVVTSPNDVPPFVTVISASQRKVLGSIAFKNASGLEQPAWNPTNGKFYVSVPSTDANPGGEIAEIDVSAMAIAKVTPLSECVPAGIVFGPQENLFVACSQDQILTYGTAFSQVLDMSTGKVLANISGIAGVDQVAYNPTTMLYYASAYQNLAGGSKTGAPSPEVGIIDAKTYTLIQTLKTDNVTAHSVAIDTSSNQMVIPLTHSGIALYSLSTANATSGNTSSTATATHASSSATKTSGGVSNYARFSIYYLSALILGVGFLG